MGQWTEDLISDEQAVTLDGLFAQRVKRSPEAIAYGYYDRPSKSWNEYSWQQMADQVARWQHALEGEGLKEGDRVGLILRNCPEWVMFDQAALSLGLVVVPFYTDDRPENIAYILQDSDVKLLLVQDAGRWKHVAPVVTENETLNRVILLDQSADSEKFLRNDERVRLKEQWLPSSVPELKVRKGDGKALASIVYTSGTTGRSKGVMLNHYNMLSIAHAAITAIDCYRQDVFMSFLPLSHTLERTAGYYLPMMAGAKVVYSRSIAQLGEDLLQIRPTVLIAVPRIFEKVYGRISGQLKKKSPIARGLFNKTVDVGWKRFEASQGRGRAGLGRMLWPLLNKLVASKVLEKLGGRLRITVSGGAALSPEIARVFIGLGLPIVQGYGLTETSPVLSVNTVKNNYPAGVGLPLRGVDVKIGDCDELVVKSPGIMMGYWNNHAATAKIIDADGWLHTGDQAKLVDGHVVITGRLKDILVLSNGEKVPPGDMEMAISLDPLFEQVMVVGEGQSYLAALIVIDEAQWVAYAKEQGFDPADDEKLNDPRVSKQMQRRIKDLLSDFPGYAKVRKVTLLRQPWTIEDGLLTPTMKIKRPKVLEKYADEVAAMYK